MLETEKNVSEFEDAHLLPIKELLARQRMHLWKRRLQKFRERNPLAWVFDEFPPQEMYRSFEFRRSTRQEAWHHWLRQRTSWTFLGHLKTITGVRYAAAAGLISAVFQAAPDLLGKAQAGGTAFKWLLIAGLCYLTAVFLFEIFCPLLLKQVTAGKQTVRGVHGRRWMRALVENELRRWWGKREWIPHDYELDKSQTEDQTILAIMNGYGIPAYAGFDSYATAHIEVALDEFAKSQNIRLWRYDHRRDKLEEFSPRYGLEANKPLMEILKIYRPNALQIEQQLEVSESDLVVGWYRSGVGISHHIPSQKNIFIDREAEGLHHLFKTDSCAHVFTEIIAYWQDSMHPLRRLLVLLFYFMSSICFVIFVFEQLKMTFSGSAFFG